MKALDVCTHYIKKFLSVVLEYLLKSTYQFIILKSESRSKRRLFHPPVYNKTVHGPDEHYGATADLTTSPDMSKEEFEIKKDIFLSRLKLTGEQIEQIEKGI